MYREIIDDTCTYYINVTEYVGVNKFNNIKITQRRWKKTKLASGLDSCE